VERLSKHWGGFSDWQSEVSHLGETCSYAAKIRQGKNPGKRKPRLAYLLNPGLANACLACLFF
jgi:hypothetical protein